MAAFENESIAQCEYLTAPERVIQWYPVALFCLIVAVTAALISSLSKCRFKSNEARFERSTRVMYIVEGLVKAKTAALRAAQRANAAALKASSGSARPPSHDVLVANTMVQVINEMIDNHSLSAELEVGEKKEDL